MEVVHISAECYPVAKAGGLGDVVGALPKYQNKAGITSKVVMPMYRTPFLYPILLSKSFPKTLEKINKNNEPIK